MEKKDQSTMTENYGTYNVSTQTAKIENEDLGATFHTPDFVYECIRNRKNIWNTLPGKGKGGRSHQTPKSFVHKNSNTTETNTPPEWATEIKLNTINYQMLKVQKQILEEEQQLKQIEQAKLEKETTTEDFESLEYIFKRLEEPGVDSNQDDLTMSTEEFETWICTGIRTIKRQRRY